MASVLRILHVSDIHLSTRLRPQQLLGIVHRPKHEAVETLRAELATQARRAIEEDIDMLAVLAGDVSLLGKAADIKHALAWWPATVASPNPVYVLGNHDYWGGSVVQTARANSRVRSRVFARFWPTGPAPVIDLPGLRVRLYFVDTTPHSFRRNFIADGDMPETEIARFRAAAMRDTEMDDAEGVSCLKIVVMHHPMLVDFEAVAKSGQLRRLKVGALFTGDTGDALRALPVLPKFDDIFVEAGVGFALTGHTHHWALHEFTTVQAVAASATLSRPQGFWTHDIRPDTGRYARASSRRIERVGGAFAVAEEKADYPVMVR